MGQNAVGQILPETLLCLLRMHCAVLSSLHRYSKGKFPEEKKPVISQEDKKIFPGKI